MDRITFLGGVGTVTGSKYLVEASGRRILVDCGLFQGFKQLRNRNRKPLPVSPADIDAVVLTHAHIDHSGYLPLLVKDGFRGKIHATAPTEGLCQILLPDSGHLQEREADLANREGFSRHHPALPKARHGVRDAFFGLRQTGADLSAQGVQGVALIGAQGGKVSVNLIRPPAHCAAFI